MPKPVTASSSSASTPSRPLGKGVDDPSPNGQEKAKGIEQVAPEPPETGHLRLIYSEKTTTTATTTTDSYRPGASTLRCLAYADVTPHPTITRANLTNSPDRT